MLLGWQLKGSSDLSAEAARKSSLGHIGVSLAGCAPSERLHGLKRGVFIRGIACEGLIYPSDLYCVLVCIFLQEGLFIPNFGTQWGFKRSVSALLHVRVHAGVCNSLKLGGTLPAAVSHTTLHLSFPNALKHNKRI